VGSTLRGKLYNRGAIAISTVGEVSLNQNRTVTRTELYEKAWSTPMRKLAAEFGLSDVGLAKICRKNGIPLPGIGYWRLIETGHGPERKPLPPIGAGQNETITIIVQEPKPYNLPKKADLGPVPNVPVRTDDDVTHPFAVRTKRAFHRISKDERGLITPKEVRASHLKVSADALPRALRILDALLLAAEEHKYSVRWPASADAALTILVDAEELHICLTEKFAQKTHALTPEEIARRKKNLYDYAPKWDYVATGLLRLSIQDLPYELSHFRKSWSDGATRRLETCLGEFIAVLPHVAKAVKAVKEERARENARRQEEAKQAEENRRKQAEYDRKAKVVAQFLQGWRESKALRAFVAAIEKKLNSSAIGAEQKQEMQAIAEWIAHHADYVDPLTDFDWMVGEFKNPSWQYW